MIWLIYRHRLVCCPNQHFIAPCGASLSLEATVYPKKCAHGFVVLCFVVVMQSFIMNSHDVFIHIHQGCFAGTGVIVRLPQCQWSKPDGYGKISQCITTTKHSKAKTVCIFLGIYNSLYTHLMTLNDSIVRILYQYLTYWLHFIIEPGRITGFDAEACWPLNGPLFSPLNPLYSLMGVGATGPPLSTNWSGRVLQAIPSVMIMEALTVRAPRWLQGENNIGSDNPVVSWI